MNDIAVITCTWKRPENLRRTLDMLETQEFTAFDVHLINNNHEIRDIVDAETADTSLVVHVQHNDANRGAYARIEKMVELRDRYAWFMTIDDDMVFGSELVCTWDKQRAPNVVFGWQGWTFHGNYWERDKVSVGESCSYLWGGNMFIPAEAMRDDGILALDEVYWNCEDIWLAYYTNHVLGFDLRMGVGGVRVDEDGKDEYLKHHALKVRLLDELRGRGWNV